jgi:hypothetical protein
MKTLPHHQISYCRLFSVFLLLCFFYCIFDHSTGTVDDTDSGVEAMICNPDGTPAEGASIKIFEVADTTKTPVVEEITDKNGRFNLDGLAKGTYNVYAEKDELVAFQDSINVLEDTIIIKDDTLETPIDLSGIVGLQPNHDPRTVTVQVLGTDIYSNVNEDGYFTLSRMAKGDFTLKLSTTLQNYTTTYGNLTIDVDTPDTLSDTLWLIYTGIPVGEGLTATYDTLNGVVTLSWNSTKYRDFQDYLIYRDCFDSLNMSSTPITFTDDTVFQDTIFNKSSASGSFSFSDTNDYHFKYRVSVRNNSQEEGLSYKYCEVYTASPAKVATEISVESYHMAKAILTSSSSINDSIQFIINLSNQTRELREIKYTELEDDSIVKRVTIDSMRKFQDTLYYLWETIGQKKIEIAVLDLAGTLWKDTVTFEVTSDLPDILFADALVYLNVPFNLTGVDTFGSVESLSIDTSRYVRYEKKADSIIQVTISDTLTDNFALHCLIVDDDGNQVNKSVSFSTGLKWEKIADNFSDTNTIRSVVELNNTLFAFVTSSNSNTIEKYSSNFLLYSSTDAVTWNKSAGAIPWSHWFTRPVVHNGKIFLIEAISDSSDTNRIWYSSNGVDWQSEKIANFHKWYSTPKYYITSEHYYDFQEMILVSFNGKLWACSSNSYGYNTTAEFYSSSDGIDWVNVSAQFSPFVEIDYYSTLDPIQYIVTNDRIYYLTSQVCDLAEIYETADFITHNKIGTIIREDPATGSCYIPTPVFFMNTLILCSSDVTIFGERMVFLNSSGEISSVKYPYPGSLAHSCFVFNEKLYSISNNGVYSTK